MQGMSRLKILILENDDFLRELLGNILHKQGYYILNGTSIDQGVSDVENHHIDIVILGASCPDYKGSSSFNFVNKNLGNPQVFLIPLGNKKESFLPKSQQFPTDSLSVKEMINVITR